jgi:predicted DCC family thiol-disulfide oxidoreductase YuxK
LSEQLTLVVFYNGGCSICGPEISLYQKIAAQHRITHLQFQDISVGDLPTGYSRETLLKALHVEQGGAMLAGAPAFIAMWRALPRFVWLARAIDWQPMRGATNLFYNYLLAPFLYRRFIRSQAKT